MDDCHRDQSPPPPISNLMETTQTPEALPNPARPTTSIIVTTEAPEIPPDPERPTGSISNLVHINVYDVLPIFNIYLRNLGIALYHSGVSVYGKEYSYFGSVLPVTGVYSNPPRTYPWARFRKAVPMGTTHLTREEVVQLIEEVKPVWLANSYNLFTKNCNNFSSYLCEQLTGNAAPKWLNRPGKICGKVEFLFPTWLITKVPHWIRKGRVVDDQGGEVARGVNWTNEEDSEYSEDSQRETGT